MGDFRQRIAHQLEKIGTTIRQLKCIRELPSFRKPLEALIRTTRCFRLPTATVIDGGKISKCLRGIVASLYPKSIARFHAVENSDRLPHQLLSIHFQRYGIQPLSRLTIKIVEKRWVEPTLHYYSVIAAGFADRKLGVLAEPRVHSPECDDCPRVVLFQGLGSQPGQVLRGVSQCQLGVADITVAGRFHGFVREIDGLSQLFLLGFESFVLRIMGPQHMHSA